MWVFFIIIIVSTIKVFVVHTYGVNNYLHSTQENGKRNTGEFGSCTLPLYKKRNMYFDDPKPLMLSTLVTFVISIGCVGFHIVRDDVIFSGGKKHIPQQQSRLWV